VADRPSARDNGRNPKRAYSAFREENRSARWLLSDLRRWRQRWASSLRPILLYLAPAR